MQNIQSFYDSLNRLSSIEFVSDEVKSQELYDSILNLFHLATAEKELFFPTLNARIQYVAHHSRISGSLYWNLIQLLAQIKQQKKVKEQFPSNFISVSITVLAQCAKQIFQVEIPASLKKKFVPLQEKSFDLDGFPVKSKLSFLRVYVVDIDESQSYLICKNADFDGILLKVKYNVEGVNQQFNGLIQGIKEWYSKSALLYLEDIWVNEQSVLVPSIIVLEPDYLVDVTSIAECFQPESIQSMLHVLGKFKARKNTLPIAIGNTSNYYLDELLSDSQVSFEASFKKLFQTNPLSFLTFSDDEIRFLKSSVQIHFENLRRVLEHDFKKENILISNCYLEPTFYSNKYGIQGRLDVWHQPLHEMSTSIVELKSGSLYRPNLYGVNAAHYAQICLYDLLISSVYPEFRVNAYLLYSKIQENQLRYVRMESFMKKELMKIRNEIVLIEKALSQVDKRPFSKTLLSKLSASFFEKQSKFTKEDASAFEAIMQNATPLERAYFQHFTAFIAREAMISKLGMESRVKSNGISSLWLDDLQTKIDQFSILSDLVILEDLSNEVHATIRLSRTENTPQMSNFRKGDIAILYPMENEDDNVMHHQLFKGTIAEINAHEVLFKLHARQFNSTIFSTYKHWFLEPDAMEKSFAVQYHSLFAFLQSKKEKKDILLGLKQPIVQNAEIQIEATGLSELQKETVQNCLSAQDYFLLMGPPGTGKTKIILSQLVKILMNQPEEQILLMAYTNRAVDEICDAIHEYAQGHYLRLGTRYNCDERFESSLFSKKSEEMSTRKEMLQLIRNAKIIVSTVSSLINRPQWLELKSFTTAIIDEASQIPETLLIGLVPQVKRFIMIGDHNQLPAVVLQSKEQAQVFHPALLEIQLSNMGNSLFERLYNRCKQQGWHEVLGFLTEQGRMHQDIYQFVNEQFYQNKLSIAQEQPWQKEALPFVVKKEYPALLQALATKRCVFFDTGNYQSVYHKTNEKEARYVVQIIKNMQQLYRENHMELPMKHIGVITPFRAQMAKIRSEVEREFGVVPDLIIDTVERFQGSTKEMVILSTCIQYDSQWDSIMSMSVDGQVDRKLNVALSRARKHLFVVGNKSILQGNQYYAKLTQWMYAYEGEVILSE